MKKGILVFIIALFTVHMTVSAAGPGEPDETFPGDVAQVVSDYGEVIAWSIGLNETSAKNREAKPLEELSNDGGIRVHYIDSEKVLTDPTGLLAAHELAVDKPAFFLLLKNGQKPVIRLLLQEKGTGFEFVQGDATEGYTKASEMLKRLMKEGDVLSVFNDGCGDIFSVVRNGKEYVLPVYMNQISKELKAVRFLEELPTGEEYLKAFQEEIAKFKERQETAGGILYGGWEIELQPHIRSQWILPVSLVLFFAVIGAAVYVIKRYKHK